MSAEFQPDWLSRPGDTIRDAIEARNLSFSEVREACGLSASALEALFRGEHEICSDLAERLADTLGGSRQFWLRREFAYRSRLASSSEPIKQTFDELLGDLPISDMRRLGWFKGLEAMSKVEVIKAFFGDTPGAWEAASVRAAQAVRFRISGSVDTNPAAVAAWLRQGVRQARAIDCAPLDRTKLREALPEIRRLTRMKEPAEFFPKLVDLCRACGVAIVFVRTPKGCPASGAAHYDNARAIVQLSFRYRSDDHLWFTVFHELGHILLHGDAALFVEGKGMLDSEEETEANIFSARTLIPEEFEAELMRAPKDFRFIIRLAKRIGVSAGIVVGQMQKRGLLRHDQLNKLKVRYVW